MMKPILMKSLKVDVTPKSVLKRMGRRISQEKWLDTICRTYEDYWPQVRPRGIYQPVLCRPNGNTVDIGVDLQFDSKFLSSHLPMTRRAAVFLVTIGPELEHSIREETKKGKNLKAFILDCLGSNAAESAAAAIHRAVEKKFNLRMRRYSPGYNDWDISQQEILFEFLGRENTGEVGVDLTPDYMMSPRKSVSGIILPRAEQGPIESSFSSLIMRTYQERNKTPQYEDAIK